jgi:hypothetical protein
MIKVPIGLHVLSAFVLFVDNLHPLFAHDIYCRIGAGELRQTPPPARGARTSNQSATGNQYCLHGSVWDAITGRQYTWYHDPNP